MSAEQPDPFPPAEPPTRPYNECAERAPGASETARTLKAYRRLRPKFRRLVDAIVHALAGDEG